MDLFFVCANGFTPLGKGGRGVKKEKVKMSMLIVRFYLLIRI